MDPENSTYDDPGLLNMDSVPSFDMDPGMNMDIESALHVDLRTNLDQPIAHTSVSSMGSEETIRCVNCGTDITHARRHILSLAEVRLVILQWIAPQVIGSDTMVCHLCWIVALNESNAHYLSDEATTSTGRRRQICVNCRRSLMYTRSHALRTDMERESRIRNIIRDSISPHELRATDKICHPCWQRSDRQAARSGYNTVNAEGTISLPHLTRAADTQAYCFFPGCNTGQRLNVPLWLRLHLFTEYNFYVPKNCRICTYHLNNNNWEVLRDSLTPNHIFTVEHIQDFASFVKERNNVIDFTNIERMSDDIIHYWIGLSKQQFMQLRSDLPRLAHIRKGTLALAAYLMKLRTGDSNERLSTLLNIPCTTLIRLMNKARDLLFEDFVPSNLGIGHITRGDIASRNLIIPNGLFGGEERKPIIILDGTYLYVQKSSNYLYQKNTYSLHKYRNLIKPFLMVCSDGYIIDVLGPYPATTSDANIIIHEFSNEMNPLRQYFQAGDVFILDRGFRDCLPLLEQCNYSVDYPISLQENETQLSTLAANKSRTVPMFRWVVEVVNGIFKSSFKIFRPVIFNCASNHAITDFKIAAALINVFRQRVTDREDAVQILNIVNEKLHTNNTLADYVIANNLNRRRAHFTSINVSVNNVLFPTLTYNELILLACGTYQIKQARSYYGEHIRNDGSYTIEVCTDSASEFLEGFPLIENCTLLRAKIQSRHISRKIYFVYILYENNVQGREALKQYCCNCIVGQRTVGCCAHVMTVVWYLSWARYENITPPAQFVDNILLTYDSD